MLNYKLLNHTRKRLLQCLRTTPRDLCSITQERDFYAQGQLRELPLPNHYWKRLLLTITNNWIRFWILDIQSEVFTKQYKQNRLYFSRHLRILRYELLKEFSKLLMFKFATFLHRVLAFCLLWFSIFFKSLSLFIEDFRDVENLAVTSTCLAWSFDSSPLIFCLIW